MKKVLALAPATLVALACSGSDPQVPTNKPPTVLASLTPTSPNTSDTLTVTATATDPEGRDVTLTYAWTKDGSAVTEAGPTIAANLTARGEVWKVTVTPTDGVLTGEAAEAMVTIVNAPPKIDGVTIAPDPALASDELVATPGNTSDLDDDEIMVRYRWTADGTVIAEGPEATLPAGSTTKGQAIVATVIVSDGTEDGTPVSSNTVVIGNSVPSISGVAISPTSGGATETFLCAPQGWADADGDAESYDFAWTINGTAAGSTTSSISGGYVRGDVLTCTATPNDGEATGAPMTSAPLTIGNTAPTIESVRISPTTPVEGDTVTATINGHFDPDGDPEAYAYQWRVNTRIVSVNTSITGADFAKGDTIIVTITPTDGIDNGPFLRSNTATVGNSPPSAVSAIVDPNPATSAGPLVAIVNGWTDADAADRPNYEYQWYVNQAAIPGATAIALDPSNFVRGDSVYFEATPFDGTDRGGVVTAPPVTIANSPPGAPTVTITPAAATFADDLVCTIVTPAIDPDGDVVTYGYVWRRNGVVTNVTTATVTAAETSDRDVWACDVTATDGNDAGMSATAEITITPACDALTFDGVDDYAAVAANAALAYGASATVEAWVRWDGTSLAQVASQIYGHAPANEAMQIGIFQSDTTTGTQCPGRAAGQPYFSWNGAAGGCLNDTVALPANAWHHIAGVYGPGGALLFVDGQQVAINATPPAMAAGSGAAPVGIGGYAAAAVGGAFDGAIAEVRVSNVARYLAEFVPVRRMPADAQTIAAWRFDDGTGVSSVSEGTALTATINGATWLADGPICEFDPIGITATLSNAVCQFTSRCEPALYGFLGWDDNICLNDRNSQLLPQYDAIARMISGGRVQFSETQLAACLAAYQTVDCETQLDAGVCDFLTGVRPNNQGCSSSVECPNASFCTSGSALACGVCQQRAADGQSCANAACFDGSQCLAVGTQQLCINFRNNVGAQCGTVATGLCRGRLHCVLPGTTAPGTCQRPAAPNAVCSADNTNNVPACNIYMSQTCNAGRCADVTWTAPQNPCSALAQCNDQGLCDPATNQCVARPAPGTACNGGVCNDTAFCNAANQCVLRLVANTACTASAECEEGLVCQAGVCRRFDWDVCN